MTSFKKGDQGPTPQTPLSPPKLKRDRRRRRSPSSIPLNPTKMSRLLRFQNPKKFFSTQPKCLHPPSHTPVHKIPSLLTTPTTPPDMINALALPSVSYLDYLDSDIPEKPVLDLRLATCPVCPVQSLEPAIHTTIPNLRVHSLKPSKIEVHDNVTYVTHLNNTLLPPVQLARLEDEANQIALGQLNFHNINQRALWTYWYADKCFKEDNGYMASQIVKNSRYSKDVEVHNYIPLLHSLGSKLFDEGPNDIRRYLKQQGFITGRFYDSHDFANVLKLYFRNHDVYLAFKEHPVFKYIYLDKIDVLLTTYGHLLDHPMVPLIPSGKFMLRHI